MGQGPAAGEGIGCRRCSSRVGRGRRAAPPSLRRRQVGDIGGGEVGAGAVQTCGVAPPAGGVAGDVDADFHHQLGLHQRDVQRLPGAPPGGERSSPSRDGRAGPERVGRRTCCWPSGRGWWCGRWGRRIPVRSVWSRGRWPMPPTRLVGGRRPGRGRGIPSLRVRRRGRGVPPARDAGRRGPECPRALQPGRRSA